MTLLIIGSEGFIGSHCVKYFSDSHKCIGADVFEQPATSYHYRKISRLSPEFDELLQVAKFDSIINAAGSGNVPYSMTHPMMDFEANVFDTIRILDGIRKYQPQAKYIHLSSAAVYGNPQKLPISEDDQLNPISPYGWHKVMAENLCKEYTSIFNLNTAIVRPFSVYGPGLKKQLFWDWHKKAKNSEGKIELIGTGNETRDYIYIMDLVLALDLIIRKGKHRAEIYNLASGSETEISQVASIFFPLLNAQLQYEFNGQVRAGDPINWRADISKLRALGFENVYSIQSGIVELVDWLSEY